MGLAAGPVTFQRFFALAALPSAVDDRFMHKLERRSFEKAVTLPDDTQIGWIGPRHVFDTPIVAGHCAYGRFVWLGLRVDRLRVPANVLKGYIRMAEQAALDASGREMLTKFDKRKARETALAQADKERSAGDFRRPAAYPVLIDLEQSCVYLASTSAPLADKLMQLFRETFSVALEPADAARVATRRMLAAKNARALEHLTPFHLVRPKDRDVEATDFEGDLSFLGREFLTWLWWQIDSDAGALRVRTGDELHVSIDRMLRLRCDFGLTGVALLTADGVASLPEARIALRHGKQPTKCGLVLGGAAGEFRFTLDAAKLAVSGLIVPEPEGAKDLRGRLEARFESIADCADLIDALFELFLHRRTGREWNRELREMTGWAAGKTERAAAQAG